MFDSIKVVFVKALASGLFVSYPMVWLFPRTLWTGAGLLGAFWGVLAIQFFLPQDLPRYALVLFFCLLLSVWVSSQAEIVFGRQDDPRILIDETVGFLVSMTGLPKGAAYLTLAFVLFRILDVYKPLGIRWFSHLPRGWGVVADDVAAGLMTNVVIQLLQALSQLLK